MPGWSGIDKKAKPFTVYLLIEEPCEPLKKKKKFLLIRGKNIRRNITGILEYPLKEEAQLF